nr:MAG TPA: hypothetical protein [Caudoviricetes sp.]
MNDNMCEKCKYKDVPSFGHPCMKCKHSFVRGTCQFDTSKSFFEPETEEDAEQLQPAPHGYAELRGACQHLPPAQMPQIGRVAGVLQVGIVFAVQ